MASYDIYDILNSNKTLIGPESGLAASVNTVNDPTSFEAIQKYYSNRPRTVTNIANNDPMTKGVAETGSLNALDQSKIDLNNAQSKYYENAGKRGLVNDIVGGTMGLGQLGLGYLSYKDNKETAKLQRDGMKKNLQLADIQIQKDKDRNAGFRAAFA